ncbi:MAG TPA: Gldg family protein, partial [Gemmataceae bacterium]|nr:Gldg family protein [Gemmataceae bacterium]
GRSRPQDSMTVLVQSLGRGNYETRPLRLDEAVKEIPSDASVVVIARPLSPLPDNAIKALRTYLQGSGGKHGKVIALLNGVSPSGAPVSDPRLDELLGEYNIALGHDRIVAVNSRLLQQSRLPPTVFAATADPASDNAIAQAFSQVQAQFIFSNAQTVEVKATHPEIHAAGLLQTTPVSEGGPYTFSLTDPHLDARSEAIKQLDAIQARKLDPSQSKPLSVAAAVSTSGASAPVPPGHPPIPGGEQPVMAVFGDGSWVSNEMLSENNPLLANEHYSLFKSTVDWLREKPTIGQQVSTKPGIEREEFSLEKISEPASWAVEITPGAVMLCGVLALGLGVALVRRR